MTKTALTHLILAAVLFLSVLGAYTWWYAKVSALSNEAAQLSGDVASRGEAGGRTVSVRRALDQLVQDEAKVYSHFVAANDVVPFLESIESTGESLGTNVEVVSVGSVPSKAPNPGYVQVSLRITGSFSAVMRTLGAIEHQSYDTTLTSLTLDTPPSDSAWTAAASFQVGMTPVVGTTTATTTQKSS